MHPRFPFNRDFAISRLFVRDSRRHCEKLWWGSISERIMRLTNREKLKSTYAVRGNLFHIWLALELEGSRIY